MSRRQYFMAASKKKSETSGDLESYGPQVNRFSDIVKVDERRHEILDYLMAGLSADQICEYMDEPLSTIQEDIKEIYKIGYTAKDDDIEEVRAEIMQAYRLVKKEALIAFKISQGETVKTVVEESMKTKKNKHAAEGVEVPRVDSVKTTTEFKAGEPRFLNVIIDASKEMGKVSGAQKHKEVAVQNNIQNNQAMTILSPNRTQLPSDFDEFTKKPEGAKVPDAEGITSEDI